MTWSAWKRETRREYTNLPAGKYCFHVQAKTFQPGKSGSDVCLYHPDSLVCDLVGISLLGGIYILARVFNLYLTTLLLQGFFTILICEVPIGSCCCLIILEPENLFISLSSSSSFLKVFFKTRASKMDCFDPTYPHINVELAKLMVNRGIDCIGIDSPSIEAFDGEGAVHRKLLSNGVVIIELLDLSLAREGDYWMIALPLKLKGLDGSPCRVLLLNSLEALRRSQISKASVIF
jgi:hypothetical protein